MEWYQWKWWRLAWNGNSGSRVECSGWVWKRIAGRLMFRCHRTEPRVVRLRAEVAELRQKVRDNLEDASKYRQLMKSLGTMPTEHPPVWDSRNIQQ